MTGTIPNLTQQFPFDSTQPIYGSLQSLMAVLEGRLEPLEAMTANYTSAVTEMEGVATAQINDFIQPTAQLLNNLMTLGFMVGNSTSSVILALGPTEFTITAGAQRTFFSPTQYVAINRLANPNDRAIAQLSSYNNVTGALNCNILSFNLNAPPAAGPFTDWQISCSAGVVAAVQTWAATIFGGGRTIWHGSGAPGVIAQSAGGDFYIDDTGHNLYGPLVGSAWGSPASMVGPQGIQGIQGIPGSGVDATYWTNARVAAAPASYLAQLNGETLGETGTINSNTSSYVLALTDVGHPVEMNVATSNTLTVPPNASVAFPIDTRLDAYQYGAGQTAIVAGAGVTIRSANGFLKIAAQYGGVSLLKRATDEWILLGALAP